ncbi:hypothetical protein PVAND_001885 [Polypedilum vanderplanki]|uniref:Protein stum n=1 Tax=Polypedilum vanderplanki TaxID=319348 RepID=A0A9J6BQN4_POLVA|nr:hypothetical protein PVAND_001885 [Polypedilum vanderplanki]
MHGYDSTVRSRYDYYYSISSPSLSQATNYYENQASLFGEPVQPLLPPPIQKSPSPQHVPTPLTPFSNPHISSSSSTLTAGAHTNFATTDRHPSLIENFDNHLYESIRKNILDKQNNNQDVTNDLTRHQIWTKQHNSSSSTDSPPRDDSEFNDYTKKRASTAFDNYRNVDDDDYLSENKFRTVSAMGNMRKFHQISTETTSDTDNNNKYRTRKPQNFLQKRNKSKSALTLNINSASSSSSKLNHTVSHVVLDKAKPKLTRTVSKKNLPTQAPPFTMVKSKSDLMSLKSYPEAFTIVTSPRRSPSAGACESKRRKISKNGIVEEDDDSIMDYEWVTPPAAKLYEAAQMSDKIESIEEPPYITNIFGQHVSIPTTPILTDKVMIGSSHRVPPETISNHSHKKLAFAIINDYKNRRTRLMQHRRNSEDDLFMSGRFSPYTRYCLQRELSEPALNRIESFETDDGAGEFYYVLDDEETEESGRKTSIGFVHKKSRLSSSMSNLSKRRPKSELQKTGPRFMSTPDFVQINKRAVIQSQPMEKINPRLILHRSLKGVLKVFNNTNIQKRTFSLDNMDIFLPNGQVDPNFLMPMPINNEEKRSEKLNKQQEKLKKKRAIVMRKRRLSPIAGTPNKEAKDKDKKDSPKTPRRLKNTPIARLQERLKKDKFGRLITEKKPPLPDFRNTKKSAGKKKKGDITFDDDKDLNANEDDERDQKAISFMQQLQAKNILGRTLKARIDAKKPPPLTRQPSKQSIESLFQDKDKTAAAPPPLKKKSSHSSLKSLTSSIRTVGSIKTNKSNSTIDDEEAEAGDEITKLKNVKEAKRDTKSKIKGSMKILSLGRASSAASTKSQKDSAPPPSRTASKTSILSHTSVSKAPLDSGAAAHDTPSRKSEILRAPSASSVMSMTTAAITSNPLNTTLTITNQLATQGAEILEKKEKSGTMIATDEIMPAPAPAPSHPDADRSSMASQKTISSQKTGSKPGSRKTSAKVGGKDSAKSRGSFLGAIVHAHHAVKQLTRKKSSASIRSEKSDATQLTMGQGHGVDNKDSSLPHAGKILEHSQRSLENVQKTVDKATHEIHQTINEKLSDLKTLEKQLSKSNLLEHDANNNDVKKSTKGTISRHSTKLDMSEQSTTKNTGTTNKSNLKTSTMMDKDRISVNAISVAPIDDDDDGGGENMSRTDGLHHQDSDDSNQMDSSTSSSMNEMGRKRKLCWGLSSCCDRQRSESAQMIAGKSSVPPTKYQKFKNCMCYPFDKMCKPFKRRKVESMDMKKESRSWWERMCCCSGCCRRCTKKGREKEKMKKKKMMKDTMAQKEKSASYWNRMNCFKFCKSPCCNSLCCRKKQTDSMMSMDSTEPKPNETPSTCTRIFCFCCLCCRKSPTPSESQKRISMTSQQSQAKEGNWCSRLCTTLFCCCCKKKVKQDSRRTSMLSKKQSLAPTIPPPEEQKPKLDMVLVEHASLMKGAIPVLPLCLAYFCLICNVIIPGSGTILSGFLCLCIGIPRFSQHDGARGRIGSFIINWIVGVSQAFTIIFCLVGWGWSIWWGTIMVHLSKRNRRIKKAERLRQEDEERQAAAAEAELNKTAMPKQKIVRGKSRDVERGIN